MGSLWRRAVFQVLLGDYASAEELGRQLLRGADEFDPPTAWSGHLVLGVVMSNRGLLLGSLEHLERAIELADSSNDPLVVATPLHPAVIARGHAATVHWILGDNDTATRVTLDNLRFARQLPHPVSVVYAQSWAAVIEVLRGDAAMTRQRCEEAIALSSDQGLNLQADLCRVLRGWALAELGEPEVGATEIKESIEAQRALGFRVSTDFSLALLAQAQWRAGRVQEALATVEEALAEQQAVGTYQWRAELLRLKGELLWALSPEHAGEAESNVLQAIAVAREQQAASLTARAEASLRRLVGR
jgi:tetratricopeptide (TPR) repeat protein